MSSKETDPKKLEEQELATIFSLASPREKPPELVERRVREAVHAEWQRVATNRASRNRRAYFAAAAAIVLAVAATLLLQQPGQGLLVYETANVAQVSGAVTLERAGRQSALKRNELVQIRTGDELRTGSGGGVALELAGGRQLRFGEASRARFGHDGRIRLAAGKIYVNTGKARDASMAITVETSLGDVRHLGTRFQVLVTPAMLRADVREGKIAVTSESGADTLAHAGQSLTLARNGDASVSQSGTFGEHWQWVDALAPPLAIEGKSLHEVIAWASRESGREVIFADEKLEQETRDTTLHGDLVLNEPLKGLSKVMMTTRMQFVLRDNQIYVSTRR